ncbi:MAG TPA: DUF2085 domain-containing protein [Myxococcales bacterium]|nr:DUF2085 domain-containing protein [Myxococcales bacterium]
MSAPFWLSHHREDELHRTYQAGGLRLCARCLGVYPVMFAAIAVQLAARAPLDWRWDGPWTLALFAPAVIDWAVGRLAPRFGSNPWRTLTGLLAGLALGRSIYIHLQNPFPVWLQVQLGAVTVAGLAVILTTYARKPAR